MYAFAEKPKAIGKLGSSSLRALASLSQPRTSKSTLSWGWMARSTYDKVVLRVSISLDPPSTYPRIKNPMNLILPVPIARRRPILLCLALACSCVGHAVARSPISLEALQRDGYGSVKLTKGWRNNTLFVPAEINGRKIELLLDTGWGSEGITVGRDPSELHIVPEKGVEMGVTANGTRSPMRHGIAQSVVMGNVRVQNSRIYFGRFDVSGFLGHGFLKRSSAIIDLTNLRLYLRPPGAGRRVNLGPALTSIGLAEAPFFDAPGGSFVVNVEVNGVPAQMALDTGAQYPSSTSGSPRWQAPKAGAAEMCTRKMPLAS